MPTRGGAATEEQIVRPERVVSEMQETISQARARGMTLEKIARDSGVSLNTIRGWIEDGKEPSYSRALSVLAVCGKWCVNKHIAIIGYGGAEPLDEAGTALQPAQRAADALSNLAVIVADTVGGRVAHGKDREVCEAADKILIELMPLSSLSGAE